VILPIWMAVAAISPGLIASAYVVRRYNTYVRHKGGRPPGAKTVIDAMGNEAVQVTRLVRYGLRSAITYDPPLGAGPGVPVVCVHGFTMNGSNFVALRELLKRGGRRRRRRSRRRSSSGSSPSGRSTSRRRPRS